MKLLCPLEANEGPEKDGKTERPKTPQALKKQSLGPETPSRW
jgi:hypothetical protein